MFVHCYPLNWRSRVDRKGYNVHYYTHDSRYISCSWSRRRHGSRCTARRMCACIRDTWGCGSLRGRSYRPRTRRAVSEPNWLRLCRTPAPWSLPRRRCRHQPSTMKSAPEDRCCRRLQVQSPCSPTPGKIIITPFSLRNFNNIRASIPIRWK